jgi:hypothetical protein
MHNARVNRRRARVLAVLAAAGAGLSFSQLAYAQTWVNPNTGPWSNAANWIGGVPASANTTQLGFNASGNQTYTSTNDLAGTFTLNAITFNNVGTGQINVAGNALDFSGTNPAINVTGSGIHNLANNIQSTTSGVPLTVNGTGSGTLNLSGGGTLYSLNVARGATNITGGTWTLTSTHRRNDVVANINDGFWSLNVADTPGATGRFSMTGGTLNAEHGIVGIFDTSVGIATFSGAGTTATFNPNLPTASRFGLSAGVGTWVVQNSANVTGNFFEVGRQLNATSHAIVTSGGTLNAVQQVLVGRSAGVNATLTINSGGWVNNGSNSFVAAISGSNGTLLVTGAGSRFENINRLITGGGFATGGNANIIVNNGGTMRSGAGFTFTQNDGGSTNVSIDGPGSTATSLGIGAGTGSWASGVGVGSSATINVTNGAAIGVGGALFMSGGIVDAVGDPLPSGNTVFNINGAGPNTSTAQIGFLQMGQNPNGTSTANVGSQATVSVGTNLIVGLNPTGAATLNVGGNNAVVNSVGFVAPFPGTDAVGDPIPGGNGQVNVSANGLVNLTSYGFLVSGNPMQVGTLTVSGANARVLGSGTAEFDVAIDGDGTMLVNNGGLVSSLGANPNDGNSFIAANPGSKGTVILNNGSFLVGGQLQLAGNGGTNGGVGIMSMSNGAVSRVDDLVIVYAPGTMNIGTSGALSGVASPASFFANGTDLVVDGRINYNAGTLTAVGTLAVAGEVRLSSADRDGAGTPTNKKTIDAGTIDLNIGTTIVGVIDLNDNDMIVRSQPRAAIENYIANARNFGAWDQPGLTSSAAASNGLQNTTLGVIDGSDYISVHGNVFNGRTVNPNDRVVKYTFYGDTDFNGFVDGDDYARIDNGFNTGLSGWFNGDCDLNGFVDGDDYALIDNAFLTQNQTLARVADILAGPDPDRVMQSILSDRMQVAQMSDLEVRVLQHAMEFGTSYRNTFLSAIPEPGMIGLAGFVLAGSLRRRSRHR